MAYRYVAYTLDRKIVEGTIDAKTEGMAEAALYQAGHHRVLSLKEVRPGLNPERLFPSLFGVRAPEVIDFSRQLATLIESGITILTALQLLKEQSFKAALGRTIAGLIEELYKGNSLSQALSKYPQAFPYTYCQVIKASEQAGNLEVGLRQVAGYMEKKAMMKKKVTRAMAYPGMVLLMALGVLTLLVTMVLPPLVAMFTSLDAELPIMTKMLIAVASFIIDYKLYLLVGIASLTILFVSYTRQSAGKLAINKLMLKLPVIGTIYIQRNMCQFCQTAAMLLKAGILLPEIINIVIPTISNRIISESLKEVREKLMQGQGLSQPMSNIEIFPQLMVETLAVGEKTGSLDSTLATLADFYEQRVNQRIDSLVSMIEPVLTIVIGLVIGFIALSMITPLYSILGSIQ